MLLNGSLLLESIKLVETEAEAKPSAPKASNFARGLVAFGKEGSREIDPLVKRKDILA
jgi:hypothetical protein